MSILDRLLLQDLHIILQVGCGADLLGQVRKGYRASDYLQVAILAQFGADSHYVHGDMRSHELRHGFEDHPVLGIVETARGKLFKRHVDG